MRRLGLAALLLVLAGGCIRLEPETARNEIRDQIVVDALGQIGRPYRYGGSSPAGFDCSGLVQYVYAQSGRKTPRTAREQHRAARVIPLAEALPGDLLFYRFGDRGVDHVAIYLGDGQAVHAPANGKAVIVAAVDLAFWRRRFVSAGRLLE
ncbi:MAG: C40 family peptidase [Gammaproteobacteria bacterium]